jgi:hypothetical protein
VEQKPWYLSKTIIGIVVALLGAVTPRVAASLGTDPASQVAAVVDIVSGMASLVGTVLAIYGRYKATTSIGPTQNP